jgi:urease accessory protein
MALLQLPIQRVAVIHMTNAHALLRLCQLVSPALPIGGYNFSQGLEYAAHVGWVRDEATALQWIGGLARHTVGTLDVPVLLRLHSAWQAGDLLNVTRWSRFLIAARETSELRAEDRHLGRSLAKVLAGLRVDETRESTQRSSANVRADLEGDILRAWTQRSDATFATLFALAAVRWGISAADASVGYLWTWAENQVLAAVKIVPLGQSAGQRMLDALIREIPHIAKGAACLEDSAIGSSTPMHLLASAAHETQYTRLFRS